jgi:hypothetical protein
MPTIRRRSWFLLLLLLVTNAVFYSSYRIDRAYLQRAALAIADSTWSDERIVEAIINRLRYLPRLSREQVAKLPWSTQWNLRFNPFKTGARTTFDYGTHRATCQVIARVFTALLDAHGIRWERVLLHNEDLRGIHGSVEVQFQRGPGVVDPTYSIIYRHPDGRPASRKELRDDRTLFVANASKGWQFGHGIDGRSNRLSYPVDRYVFDLPLRFSYRWFGPARWFVYGSLIKFAGPDGPLLLASPSWFEWPALRWMFFINVAVGACAIMWRFRRRIKSRKQVGEPLIRVT